MMKNKEEKEWKRIKMKRNEELEGRKEDNVIYSDFRIERGREAYCKSIRRKAGTVPGCVVSGLKHQLIMIDHFWRNG